MKHEIIRAWCASCGMPAPSKGDCMALEVALTQKPPLHAEQIKSLWLYRKDIHGGDLLEQLQDFARAVESAHGITGAPS